MKKISWLALLTAAAFSINAHAAPERVGDFTLIDDEGKAHQLSKYAFNKAVVIVAQTTDCTMNQENIARYKQLRTNWDHRGVSFLMLNSSDADERAGIRAEEAVWNYDFPIMDDDTQLVANALGITKAGEVVVVDPVRMNILYRGPMPAQGLAAECWQGLSLTSTTTLLSCICIIVFSITTYRKPSFQTSTTFAMPFLQQSVSALHICHGSTCCTSRGTIRLCQA